MANNSPTFLFICSPIVDSYLLISEKDLESYGIKKGQAVIYDDTVTPPDTVVKITKERKFTDPEAAGSGVNTAKGLSLLGNKVAVLGQYGDDAKGDLITKDMKDFKIENLSIVKQGAQTSEVFICVTEDAQRTVLGSFQDSFHIDSKEVDFSIIEKYDYTFIESYAFSGNKSFDINYKTLENIEKYNKKMIFALSNAFCVDMYRDEMLKFFNHPNCRIVIGNSDEYKKMVEAKDTNEAVDILFKQHTEEKKWDLLVITDGANGAWIIGGGRKVFVEAPEVPDVIDTTGAGDYFSSGVLHGFLNNYSLENAGKFGNVFAADIISVLGVTFKEGTKQRLEACIANA